VAAPSPDPVLRLTGPVLVGPGAEAADVLGEVWVVGGRIVLDRPTAGSFTTVTGWVLPGLVDAHCHVGLDAHGAVDAATTEAQARTERQAGALLLRDAGSPADTRWVDDRDDLPRLLRAGRHIARTGRYIRGYGEEIEPAELAAVVRAQARRSDGWVKLVGDWIDRERGDLAPCWPLPALTDAVAAAHAEGARVTVHCFAEDTIADLVAAGVDGIEHATGLTAQTIALVSAAGIAIVPTLVNTATFPAIADRAQERFPTYAAHMRTLHARRHATVGAAYEAGVAVYAGTDAGGSLPHGLIAAEVAELVAAGLTPLGALSAAAWGARAWLGHDGIAEGASADLVVYPADPRADVRVLAHPTAIVLRGRLFAP